LGHALRIKVKYYEIAREVSGRREEIVELEEGSDIKNLIDFLVYKYEEIQKFIYDEEGVFLDYLRFIVNNLDIMSLKKQCTVLKDGDLVLVLPPIGGG
jgi:molybdopterin synthase sulfur carrier subunit